MGTRCPQGKKKNVKRIANVAVVYPIAPFGRTLAELISGHIFSCPTKAPRPRPDSAMIANLQKDRPLLKQLLKASNGTWQKNVWR
jgi:hypothetical protein